jgi:hypothetical protein
MKLIFPKSSAQAKRDGQWPRLEAAIRNAETLEELEATWEAEEPIVQAMPKKWQQHALDCKETRRHELGDTTAQLEASLRYLDEGDGL